MKHLLNIKVDHRLEEEAAHKVVLVSTTERKTANGKVIKLSMLLNKIANFLIKKCLKIIPLTLKYKRANGSENKYLTVTPKRIVLLTRGFRRKIEGH